MKTKNAVFLKRIFINPTSMGKRSNKIKARQEKAQAKMLENNKKRIAYAETLLMPGQHILTCSTCGVMGIYPISQSVVSHVIAPRCKIHPGEISGLML